MPSGRKIRSSSASGRLECPNVTSILSELKYVLDVTRIHSRAAGRAGRGVDDISSKRRANGENKDQPEWLIRELLQHNRRHSVTLGDRSPTLRRQHDRINSIRKLCSLKVSETMSLHELQKLKLAFEDFEKNGSGCIDVKNFIGIVKKCLGLKHMSNEQIQGLFKKIDYSGQGRISWGQFCAHMLQEHREREESTRRSKQVAFTLPATMKPLCQSLPIIPIVNIHPSHDGTIVTVREDGAVCSWSPELKLQRTKHIFDGGAANRKSKWASDFTVIPEYKKLVIVTGDREMQFYDLSTLDPYCQITALDTVPLTIDYGYSQTDKCCILYGDTEGCVTIVLISSFGDTLRLWNKLPRVNNIPTTEIENTVASPNVTFVRWKVHQDWVTQAKYFPSFQAVVSSSNDESTSLVIGCVLPLTDAEQELTEIREACYEGKTKKVQMNWTPQTRASRDQRVFTVYKGVKSFDLCHKHSMLVTGGLDRLIRIWNPHFCGKPTGFLKGHSAPVVHLYVSSEDSQVFSVSSDSTVKIWDIQDQCCLITAESKATGVHGDVSACLYSPAMKSLFIAADCMAVLSLKMRQQQFSSGRLTVSHNEPVTCCGFSEEFRQVVSCSEGSVVKVWDFDTGRQVFEFGGTRDLAAITCMTFDLKGKRLITGGRDGYLKIWNFSNGQCLKTLRKDSECLEVCHCSFLKVHRNCYVISVGRDRKIDIYSDEPDDLHHVQQPQPPWREDTTNGHKDDILCVAQCLPSLLATSSYDGEIIVWNVVSEGIQCRFPFPQSAESEAGLDKSVPSIIFLKNPRLSSSTVLLSSGTAGCINIWQVLGGGKFLSSFKVSRFQQKITKMAKTAKDTFLYAADQIGYIYVYDMSDFHPEKKSPKADYFWRAHISRVSGLQIVDNDQVVLTSSFDHTVRLWSARGECVGTFGQTDCWSIHITSSWLHPTVPYEVLIHPLSIPDHEMLNFKSYFSDAINPDETGAGCRELKAVPCDSLAY
ncbi:WD repeat-containing protein on Y chromosome [Cynoglossus semilaevis]|uniref:WD repeat-containing protein on Y chromosome n=1 Tax=Cynoglossus semilaevis TaxID=244447 RepID=UPI000D62F3EE|nr:WD repeat-containing protein on Y chromosome-like [Cynoglossus semilaevis]